MIIKLPCVCKRIEIRAECRVYMLHCFLLCDLARYPILLHLKMFGTGSGSWYG